MSAVNPQQAGRIALPGVVGDPTGGPLRMLVKAIETMQIGVTITDPDGIIVYSNPAELRMHGYALDEVVGKPGRIYAPNEEVRTFVGPPPRNEASWVRETVNVHRDGTTFPVLLHSDVVRDGDGRFLGMVTCCEDISERKRLEKQLVQSSFYDPLTGLPNRALFLTRVEFALERLHRRDSGFAVVLLDLDRFKVVNDSLGHAVGDLLLKGVAERLATILRPEDMVARLSGDEFAVLVEDIAGLNEAMAIATRVLESMAAPFDLDGKELYSAASVGIAMSRPGYGAPDEVLRDAEIAMHRSKAGGAGSYEVFDLQMQSEAMARFELETGLRRALEREELRVQYQPIVELATGRLAGLEALVRWEQPSGEMTPPQAFIPMAEQTGLIVPLGYWVLEEACRQLRRWEDADPAAADLTMSVNLSPRHFAQPDLAERVAEVLESTGLGAHRLKLEITESVVMEYSASVVNTIRALERLGVRLRIDDFGTGYCSLSYLHTLPLDGLKIDRSFIAHAQAGDRKLLRAIVSMAHNLGLSVVAEGIEEPALLEELLELGCEFAQGFYFAAPLSAEAVGDLVRTPRAWGPPLA
jgi:diguanylate cyclase (GGDEF)-like protein/PAS domain S-box-containing protein